MEQLRFGRQQNVTEMMILDLVFCYHAKIFRKLAGPLNELCGKHNTFNWGGECETALAQLPLTLFIAPVLSLPNLNEGTGEFILNTGAHEKAIG